MGASDRRLPNFFELYDEILRNQEHPFLTDEQVRLRTIENLDGCRRVAVAQGVTPLIAGYALLPLMETGGEHHFGEKLCTRGAGYGAALQEAQGLTGAFDEFIFFLVNSGYSPVVSGLDHYEPVRMWSLQLAEPQGARTNRSQEKYQCLRPRRIKNLRSDFSGGGRNSRLEAPAKRF